MGAGRTASSTWLVELVRRDVNLTDDMAMVSMIQRYHILVAYGIFSVRVYNDV